MSVTPNMPNFRSRLSAVLGFSLISLLSMHAAQEALVVLPQAIIEERIRLAPRKPNERYETLRNLFVAAGCTGDHFTEQTVKREKTPNLICTRPGSTDEVILVVAHYDASLRSPSVADNWSGAVLLPSLYQSLSLMSLHHTYVLIGFTGEEDGLVGSSAYVKNLGKPPTINIRAVVNVDTLGLGPLNIWASRANPALLNAAGYAAGITKTMIHRVSADNVGESDCRPFLDRKIACIDFHSITNETFPILHTQKDDLKAIKMEDYYVSYRYLATYVAFLDKFLQLPAEEQNPKTTKSRK